MKIYSVLVVGALSFTGICMATDHDVLVAEIEAPRNSDAAEKSPYSDFEGAGTFTIEELMVESKTPGLSVAYIQDFDIAWTRSYGLADVKSGKKVTEKTLFQAASISKPVAAMATLKAVQDGRFGLDDPINGLLTSWALPENEHYAARPVTPKMLLSHTGGTTVHGFAGYRESKPIPTVPQVLDGAEIANSPAVLVEAEPFTRFSYSGGGTTLMQLAVTETLGKDYPQIMRESVLKPIGMNDSSYDQPLKRKRMKRASRGHIRGRAKVDRWHIYPEMAAAGLWTTPTDLAKFAIEVQKSLRGESNQVLTQEMTEKMVTPVEVGEYGLGFMTRNQGDEWYFSHSGGNWGFRCFLIAHREKGYGVVIMSNDDMGNTVVFEFLQRVRDVYQWDGESD
jgi:CubicO group peptidase (beta-lactamase class C family)